MLSTVTSVVSLVCFFTHLLFSVVRELRAGSEHGPMILDREMLQLGPECLLLLRHHTVRSTLRTDSSDIRMTLNQLSNSTNPELLALLGQAHSMGPSVRKR